jgi:hypothetical protein
MARSDTHIYTLPNGFDVQDRRGHLIAYGRLPWRKRGPDWLLHVALHQEGVGL